VAEGTRERWKEDFEAGTGIKMSVREGEKEGEIVGESLAS
jgi:hypothetical protein